MSELSEASRALLAAARQGMSPDAAAVKRVHAKVSGGLLAGVAAKLMLVAVVAVGGGVIVAAQHRGADVDAPVVNVAPVEVKSIEPRVAQVEAPPPAAPIVVAKSVARREIDLAREVALIDQASTAKPAAALTILSVYETETSGRGQLAEDAAAIGIEARCKLGEDTSSLRSSFVARWPDSVHAATIAVACD